MEELKRAVLEGEVIEDYDTRVLLLAFTEPDRIPYHVVLKYYLGELITTVITTYIPDAIYWESGWKRRKKLDEKDTNENTSYSLLWKVLRTSAPCSGQSKFHSS